MPRKIKSSWWKSPSKRKFKYSRKRLKAMYSEYLAWMMRTKGIGAVEAAHKVDEQREIMGEIIADYELMPQAIEKTAGAEVSHSNISSDAAEREAF